MINLHINEYGLEFEIATSGLYLSWVSLTIITALIIGVKLFKRFYK